MQKPERAKTLAVKLADRRLDRDVNIKGVGEDAEALLLVCGDLTPEQASKVVAAYVMQLIDAMKGFA